MSTPSDPQHWARPPKFNAEEATVIRSPEKAEAGYWVGAPGIYYDASGEDFYLLYRVRRPRGVEPDRGAEARLAHSRCGVKFDDIWSAQKSELDSPSIERSAMRRLADDRWLLYISYVDPSDNRWRIDLVEASAPDQFNLADRQPCLMAPPLGLEGIKDPAVFQVGGLFYMWVSIAKAVPASDEHAMHATADAYNTGLIQSATGLATSPDGVTWHYEGEVFAPADGAQAWDRYCRRIGTAYREDGIWVALYDGSASVEENYEERVGVATSYDLRDFRCSTPHAAWMTPDHDDRRALRYLDVLDFADRRLIYFELARPDGSHDLRVAELPK